MEKNKQQKLKDFTALALVLGTLISGFTTSSYFIKYSRADSKQYRLENQKSHIVEHIAATDPDMKKQISKSIDISFQEFHNEEISLNSLKKDNENLLSEKNLEKMIKKCASEDNKNALNAINNTLDENSKVKHDNLSGLFLSGMITLIGCVGMKKLSDNEKKKENEKSKECVNEKENDTMSM